MTEPTWALEICRKLMDFEDRSRINNLQILDIKKDHKESWEECENKIYDWLEENLKMNTSNTTIDRAIMLEKNRTVIAVQFSLCKGKINILRNCYKLKGAKISIFEDFSQDTM